MSEAALEGLRFGGILSAMMGALIFASLRHDPLIWLGDAPKDVQRRFGPIPAASRRRKRAWGIPMLLGLIAVFGALALRTWSMGPLATALAAYVCFETFNLFDALVIDLGLVLVRPRWAFPAGALDSPSFRDPRWHLRNWLIGVVAGVPFAALVTAVAWLVASVVAWWPALVAS